MANGFSKSPVLITLLDDNSNPVVGIIPTFAASGAGNSYSICSATDSNGESNCELTSTSAGFKSLEILTPVSVTSGSVVFVAQTPDEANSTLHVSEYAIGDGVNAAEVRILLIDIDGIPVPGFTPTISDDGGSTSSTACSASNALGYSTCFVKSTDMETVTVSFTSPIGFAQTAKVIFTQTAFVTTWKTDNPGTSSSSKISLPLVSAGAYNFIAFWGDGTYSLIDSGTDPDKVHTYSSPGTYEVKMSAVVSGGIPQLQFSDDPLKLLEVTQWGANEWNTFEAMFKGCANLVIPTTSGAPSIAVGASMDYMFQNATGFNSDISAWNTTNVVSMKGTFKGATSFDQPLNTWITNNVTDMSEMFSAAWTTFPPLVLPTFTPMIFNRPLDLWNTSQVKNMFAMFAGATLFNGDIGNWNTAQVTNMQGMFLAASAFNQDLITSGSQWDVSKVTTMEQMFQRASSFNGDISNWNPVLNTSLKRTFAYATSFNQTLNTWPITSVTTLWETFYGATNFDGLISAWDTSNVTSMYRTFAYASNFNQNLSGWRTQKVTSMAMMFAYAMKFKNGNMNLLANIDKWNTSLVTTMSYMFAGAELFNQDMRNWDTGKLKNMSYMFYGAKAFDQDITAWNTSGVTDMTSTFEGAIVFDQPIGALGAWDTSAVTKMPRMFYGATAFNQDLSVWDVSKVTDMLGMFCLAINFNNGSPAGVSNILPWTTTALTGPALASTFYSAMSFNSDISNWNVSNVTNTSRLFLNASTFNQALNTWNTSKVTDMQRMFEDAVLFNQDLSNWDTSSVTNMYNMFNHAEKFNRPLMKVGTGLGSKWDTGSVTNMKGMFMNATLFNADLSSWNTALVTNMSYTFYAAANFNNGGNPVMHWNTSSVKDMSYMFSFTNLFNVDIDLWDTHLVTNMSYMFWNAKVFNQVIAQWITSSVTNMEGMFSGALVFDSDIHTWNVSLVSKYSGFDTGTVGTWIAAEKPTWILPPTTVAKKLFITADTFDGNLGGITGADLKCASDSNYPGVGTYKALLGDASRSILPAELDWVIHVSQAYERLDSVSVTTSTGSKLWGVIAAPFALAGDHYWTGIISGTWGVSADNCSSWGSADPSSNGMASSVSGWNDVTVTCDQLKHLLCIEQ